MGTNLLHIYPAAPGGVADFVEVCVRHQPGSRKLALDEHSAASQTLSGDCLLHLSAYGYAKRGVPFWLLKKIEAERANIRTLGVYFHELYAWGPPWRSAFWLSPMQRHIARRMAEISDFWLTNRMDSANWLCRFAADKPHAVLPVFSNIGEMPAYSAERVAKVVVFGGAPLREATYRTAGPALFSWVRSQGLELHDIGPEMSDPAITRDLIQAGAKVHGRLEADAVCRMLSDASFGVVGYATEEVAKSGVFAAYCANGVCPILVSNCDTASDGLAPNKHYLAGIPIAHVDAKSVEEIGRATWAWYQAHDVKAHAAAQLAMFAANSQSALVDSGKTPRKAGRHDPELEVEIQRQYYARTASQYDSMHLGEDEGHDFALAFLLSSLNTLGIESVLDVGAGTGRVMSFLKQAKPGLRVVGIEPSEALREIGYAKGLSRDELIDGDATRMAFKDGEFDLVCEFAVLHHLRAPERAIAEMLRVADKAIFISDSNNFGRGSAPARFMKQLLNAVGLWKLADFIKTGGKGYTITEGDGLAYSYSVFSNYRQIRAQCESVHLLNTADATANLYRSASQIVLLGRKRKMAQAGG